MLVRVISMDNLRLFKCNKIFQGIYTLTRETLTITPYVIPGLQVLRANVYKDQTYHGKCEHSKLAHLLHMFSPLLDKNRCEVCFLKYFIFWKIFAFLYTLLNHSSGKL